MDIHIENFHLHQSCPGEEILKVVKRQELLIGKIMAFQSDLNEKLQAIANAQTEAFAEITNKVTTLNGTIEALTANVSALQEQLANAGNPELPADTVALLDQVSTQARELADIVPNPVVEG